MDLQQFLETIKQIAVQGKGFKPHKLLALLTIVDLIGSEKNPQNRFYFNEDFRRGFTKYFEIYHGSKDKNRPLAPFFHLKNAGGFWFLSPLPGKESQLKGIVTVGAPRELHEVVDYAFLLPEIYQLLLDAKCRNAVKDTILRCLEAGLAGTPGKLDEDEVDEYDSNNSLFEHEAMAIDAIFNGVRKYSLGKCLSNSLLHDEATNDYYECDVIVVNYAGIYLVELKHWSGRIQIASYNWSIDRTKYRRDPHATNVFKAKILKGIYQHQFRTYPPELWVESVVILTNPEAEVIGASSSSTDKHCPTFESIEAFLDYLRYQDSTKTKLLSLSEIQRIVDYLESLRHPKRAYRYSIPGYEVVEHLTQRPNLVEVVARPTTGRYRQLSRFRVFYPPVKADPFEKERFVKRSRNTLDAVSQIGDHANVLRVWRVPDETGALIEGSDWSEEGTLKDWMQDREQQEVTQEEALAICCGILRALEVAHQKGVIHRAVKPENILMVNGQPKLMNFDLSYQLASEQNITVIPDVSVLKRDAYTAPEVFAKEDVDDSTDLFSVGVILYELLVGEKPFKSSTDLDRLDGYLSEEPLSKLRARGISQYVVETLERMVRSDRTGRLKNAAQVLAILEAPEERTETSDRQQLLNQKLEPGSSYDVYRIERLIGEGSEAQVYEARTLRNEPVALKIFNRDIPLARILDEEHAGAAVKSSYLAQAKRSGHWNNDRYFIEMNLIDGRLMRDDISRGMRPDKDNFVRVASCLLEAVQALHRGTEGEQAAPLLHGDIKPDNVILKSDGGAVLFDFGCAGPPRVDKYQGTEGYVAPDLMSGADLQFCESGDLFALGVSLFEWLCGARPYVRVRLEESPSVPSNFRNDLPLPLLDWLLRAVQPESSLRFRDIDEMWAMFQSSFEVAAPETEEIPPEPVTPEKEGGEIIEPVIPRIEERLPGNPFVAYLNSLHSASINNENLAESQAVSPYFGFIYVPLKVTEHIYRQLTAEDGSHVILTGHAGDGKSTIGLDLFKRSRGYPPEKHLEKEEKIRPMEEIQLNGREIILIKDMSEINEEERLGILKQACRQDHSRYFIISNTGTLLNTFKGLVDKSEWPGLQNQLLAALEAGIPKKLSYQGGNFQIINLVRTDNISTACKIFERMLAPERWALCEDSTCREKCPVYDNVKMLREHWDTVIRRLELVYRRLFEYGSRLTLRQITGHLAYAITAGLNYDDISRLAEKAKRPPVRHFLFFNRFFGDCGEIPAPQADQLRAVRTMRALEPGRRTHRRLDRLLWMREEGGDVPMVGDGVKPLYDYLRQVGSGQLYVDTLPKESARMQVRRLLFFYGSFKNEEAGRRFVSTFLDSPMIVDFARWQKEGGSLSLLERKRLKQGVLHVLQEHFTGIRLPENAADQETVYITLNRHNYEIRQSAQIVLAKFQADSFDLILQPFDSGIGEIRYDPKLRETTTGKVLTLELPFLDYVTNRFHGEIAQKLQSFYADRLEHFKVELLGAKREDQGHNMMLIRLQLNHRFKSQTLSVHDNVLEVTS